MDMLDIKNNFHQLIESIEDEAILLNFYHLMSLQFSENNPLLIDRLSSKQYQELMLAFEESFEEDNLIEHAEIKERYAIFVDGDIKIAKN